MCHLKMISNNPFKILRIYIFLRENVYLPYMRFLYRKSLFKNVFDHNFFICQPILKIFCCTFCDKLNAQLCQENILDKFKQLQNICEKSLSHTSVTCSRDRPHQTPSVEKHGHPPRVVYCAIYSTLARFTKFRA